ncbi:MAG: ATP-dependent DNA helicase [Phycisphaerales bacterium]
MANPVSAILSSSGPVAAALGEGFESRPEQARMAEAVAQAMEAKSHLLVEAGTGVGKSFAYLVPAILRCVLHKERVVIATNTIALQEQLIEKDIPALRAAMEAAGGELGTAVRELLRPVLVKGRGNYVSLRRLKMASQRQDRLLADAASRRSLRVIEEWAYATRDGTLSTLPTLERPAVWDRAQSDAGNCMGRKCPTYEKCFYQAARREMEKGNLLVCNHALFFSDLALGAREHGFLPAYQQVVLDEAHGAEDAAADHFGLSVSEGRVMHLLGILYHSGTGKGYLTQLQLATGDVELADGLIRATLKAENSARMFFEELLHWSRRAGTGRVRGPGVVENLISSAFEELALRLLTAKERIASEADKFELNAYALRAAEVAECAKALLAQSVKGCAYWVEVSGGGERGRSPRVTIACSPVDVAPILREHLFKEGRGVVLTSATLATGAGTKGRRDEGTEGSGKQSGAFAHAMSRLGCGGAETLLLGSPFEYSRQVEVYVERSMPRPERAAAKAPPATGRRTVEVDESGNEVARRGDEGTKGRGVGLGDNGNAPLTYNEMLAARILHHIDATDGGAFVLFTSFASLNSMARLLEGPLAARKMPLLAQGRDGPRTELLERFRRDERSVLLGAASFWQGVDVRGRGLRNVIITRLPFEPPDRPLTEARLEAISERGGDPFREDSLPRAIIRFKQGFGRLVRSKTDRGRVVILDPRVMTTGYGRGFLEALPRGVKPIVV